MTELLKKPIYNVQQFKWYITRQKVKMGHLLYISLMNKDFHRKIKESKNYYC